MLSQENIDKALELVQQDPEATHSKMLQTVLIDNICAERNAVIKMVDDANKEIEYMLKVIPESERLNIKMERYNPRDYASDEATFEKLMRIVEQHNKPSRSARRTSKKDAEGR